MNESHRLRRALQLCVLFVLLSSITTAGAHFMRRHSENAAARQRTALAQAQRELLQAQEEQALREAARADITAWQAAGLLAPHALERLRTRLASLPALATRISATPPPHPALRSYRVEISLDALHEDEVWPQLEKALQAADLLLAPRSCELERLPEASANRLHAHCVLELLEVQEAGA